MSAADFEVIVIGGGHAGCEAASAAARMGVRTALLTLNPERIGFMSCNPAMGGLAKGQLIKEIDALGGIMGRNTDRTAIQYRRLNASKGPAVRSSRAQCDKALYAQEMQIRLKNTANLTIFPFEATEIVTEGGRVSGVRLRDGSSLRARAVVVTSGTFLRAIMHTGFDQAKGGRVGDASADSLSGSLEKLGFRLRRLKTGTPPRLHRATIDFSLTTPQAGDERPIPFSFYEVPKPFPYLQQLNCFITYTSNQTHEIIEQNFDRSPLFTGVIQGVGPRYCPSIEDKVKRFRDKERHQIFLEPEGLTTDEIYVNGVSTSLPRDVQEAFIRTVPGLERAEFTRFGYAVEYDAVDARQLRATLESKDVPGLYTAGQLNGTSGYEEAGAQGLVAGVNAALSVFGRDPWVMARTEGYIGVMVDDLILHGADEPYRMFTSRAEYRLLLREDNADLRLSDTGHRLGLLTEGEYKTFCDRRNAIERLKTSLSERFFNPGAEGVAAWFESRGWRAPQDRVSAEGLLRRPEISWSELTELGFDSASFSDDEREQVEVQTKYAGYIQRDLDLLEGVRKHEALALPAEMDFSAVAGLSNEVRDRLRLTRPETIGQASRMGGVTPAAVANLLIFLKMQDARQPGGRDVAAGRPR